MQITIEEALTGCIKNYIQVEKTITGLEYQQTSYFIRGQISILCSILNEHWNFNKTGQTYYAFLKYLVHKYDLKDVLNIDDLQECSQEHISLNDVLIKNKKKL